MRKVLVGCVTATLLFCATGAKASDQSGYINTVQQTQSRFFIYLSGTRTTRPSCDCCNRWEIDASTAAGQSQIAILLTLYAAHKPVTINGTGACVGSANDTEGVAMLTS